jgi:hypothetical protein
MIWGAPGIGKTDVVEGIAKEYGIPCLIVTLAHFLPEDIGGLPLLYIRGAGQSKEQTKSVFGEEDLGKIFHTKSMPEFFPDMTDTGKGILFFDEINRAPVETLTSVLTLLLSGTAAGGKYILPKNWKVWAAGNRAEDVLDRGLTELDPAVASRFTSGHLWLVPQLDDWIDWARSDNGIFIDYKTDPPTNTGEFFIPEEFFVFLEHVEKGGDITKWFDFEGKNIKTEYNQFYRFDKDVIAQGGQGLATGYPNPRSWTRTFYQIFERYLSPNPTGLYAKTKDFRSMVKPQDFKDPKLKGVAGWQYLLADRGALSRITSDMSSQVGIKAAKEFINYVQVLARHSNENGSLNEKIQHIFDDPTKPTPFMDIPPVEISEKKKILSLVKSVIRSMGTQFTMDNFLNWTEWCMDLMKNGKADSAELGMHVKDVTGGEGIEASILQDLVTKATEAVVKKRSQATKDPAELSIANRFEKFATKFAEQMAGYRDL